MAREDQARFFHSSLRTFLVQVVITALSAAFTVLSARVLGPAGKGTLTLLVMIPVIAIALLHLGIGQATIFHAPRVPAGSLVATSATMIAVVGVLAALLTLPVVLGLRQGVFKGIPAVWLIIICAAIPVVLLHDLLSALFLALFRINRRNLFLLALPALNFILFLFLAVYRQMGVKGGMIAWGLAFILSVIVGVALLAPVLIPAQARFDPGLGRDLLKYGSRSCWGSMLGTLNSRFDFFLVGLYLSPADVGFYSVAVYAAEFLGKLPESVSLVLQPRVARLPEAEARHFTPRVLRLLLPPLLVIALLIAIFSGPLVHLLFGTSFGDSGPVLLILLPGFLALALYRVLAGDLLARGHPLAYSGTSALAFAVMILLDLWLIPRFGIRGAALATTISYFLAALAIVAFYLRATGNPLRVLFVPGPNDKGLLEDAAKVIRLLGNGFRSEPSGIPHDRA